MLRLQGPFFCDYPTAGQAWLTLWHHIIVIPQLQKKKKAAALAHHIIAIAAPLLLGVPLRCAWVGLEFGSCSKTRRPNGITDAALRVQIPNARTRLLTVER